MVQTQDLAARPLDISGTADSTMLRIALAAFVDAHYMLYRTNRLAEILLPGTLADQPAGKPQPGLVDDQKAS